MNEEKLDMIEENVPTSETVEEVAATQEEETAKSIADSVKALSPTRLVLKRFFRSKLSIIGLVLIVGLFLFSFVGPLFSPYGETQIDYETDRINVVVTEFTYEVPVYDEYGNIKTDAEGNVVYESYTVYQMDKTAKKVDDHALPSAEHWLGTDADGMDVLTRIMYGGRISLTISFIVVFMEVLLGILFGGLAGYFAGWVDTIIMRVVDIFNCLPTLPLMLIIGAILDALKVPANVRIYYMMAFLTFFGWTGIARMVRGQILSLREQEYMVAAEAMGYSTPRRIFKHLIPNILPQIMTAMTLSLGSMILYESTLSYLTLGVQPPFASWGTMIEVISKRNDIFKNNFNVWGAPGICIIIAVLGFNFIGDGLRDALDPKQRR